MYIVLKEKVRNVPISDKGIKTFYPGEDLPENYEPPQDYIKQGIVGKKETKKPTVKKNKIGGDE